MSEYARRKAEAEYALQQLRAKGLAALNDERVRQSLKESARRVELMNTALRRRVNGYG